MNVESDGSYTLNIIPGSYALSVLNTTSQLPYASEFYDGGAGSNDGNEAQRIDLDAGDKTTVDLVLQPGYLISGQVLDDDCRQSSARYSGACEYRRCRFL